MTRVIRVTLLLIVSVACGSGRRVAAPAAPASPGPNLTFVVREAGRVPLESLDGVELTAIVADGTTVDLGRTFGGRVTVAKDRLQRMQPQLLLFCVEGFHCGAIRPSRQGLEPASLYAFDEYNIDLAPIVLY